MHSTVPRRDISSDDRVTVDEQLGLERRRTTGNGRERVWELSDEQLEGVVGTEEGGQVLLEGVGWRGVWDGWVGWRRGMRVPGFLRMVGVVVSWGRGEGTWTSAATRTSGLGHGEWTRDMDFKTVI